MSITKNVFLIDDDPICNFLHKKLIETADSKFNVSIFPDAISFLEYLTNNLDKPEILPDCILLDINMAEMNGWDFIEEYKNLKVPTLVNTKIFMVTSSKSEYDIEKAKSFSFIKDYHFKPLNKNKVKDILNYI